MQELQQFVSEEERYLARRFRKAGGGGLYDPVLRRKSSSKTASAPTTSASFWDVDRPCAVIHPLLSGVNASLYAPDTWRRFHAFGTEMIVTKIGRGMFPRLKIDVSGLEPEHEYTVAVDFVPVDSKRYRYTFPTSRWTVTGNGDIHLPGRWHVHPSSPAKGSVWMKEVITFDKLKITNSNCDQNGYIVLNSMHKYQPRIHVIYSGQHDGFNARPCLPYRCHVTFMFEETQFIAVTAYQNPRVTQMKIAENPFARGFRKYEDGNPDDSYNESGSSNTSPPLSDHRSDDALTDQLQMQLPSLLNPSAIAGISEATVDYRSAWEQQQCSEAWLAPDYVVPSQQPRQPQPQESCQYYYHYGHQPAADYRQSFAVGDCWAQGQTAAYF